MYQREPSCQNLHVRRGDHRVVYNLSSSSQVILNEYKAFWSEHHCFRGITNFYYFLISVFLVNHERSPCYSRRLCLVSRDVHQLDIGEIRTSCTQAEGYDYGFRGLHEIILHLWNFNSVIKGKNVTEDIMKSMFAGSLSGNTRLQWNTVSYMEDRHIEDQEPLTFHQVADD